MYVLFRNEKDYDEFLLRIKLIKKEFSLELKKILVLRD